ncbi:hypothetical protein A2Y85_08575 [candidate division WOR-3 bacterium RBG_13_43_14]|uniref:Secretion system C-terminal sorting domain-containing protein n=1 Tax=candidate division WOR-3 bacterium RBG_13_43_14 TaxID=1802590 RepID=A0A1F4UCL3_UNCW3|nr:MAG: hypothetical protein A2Y85_08575 [candidate division WOR-3 bacterium RBG_13_43_14]
MPKIAVSGNSVHVVWAQQNYGLVYRRSTDGGSTWQNIDTLIPHLGYSSIQAFGDTVYVCGAGGSTSSLRFTKSTDSGSNWSPIMTITPASNSPTLRIIANDVTNIAISYGRYGEVYSVCSFDYGATWSDSQMVSESSIASQRPAMDTDDSGGIHISWYDYKYSPYSWTGDIFYRVSRDSGNTWEAIDSLTVSHRAVASDILAENNNLHLVWEDDRYDFNDNFEIFYRLSTDLGQTWGSEVRLTDTLNRSYCPSFACDGRYLHLFWYDLRDDTTNRIGEIYYKRKDLLMPVSEQGKNMVASPLRLEIYPNPFMGELRIRFLIQDIRYKIEDVSIKLFDVSGKAVRDYRIRHGIGGHIVIDAQELPCGVYFAEMIVNDIQEVNKAIKIE